MDKYGFTSRERLEHISDATGKILAFCQGKNESSFLSDDMLHSGVLYQFLVIGEAIMYVETSILKKYPYPWHLPRSFRNYIAHEYFGINLRQVFKTVTDLLPEFKILIDKVIEEEKKINPDTDRA
ncbi:MAG: DUF86 domain-containing protein [Bacteroidetes bacterium]|nr:MAG: DUF86 domain-containing protein [Bacteroidota bacterium]